MTSITIEDLKLQATQIKTELGISHQQALHEASRRAGFTDYHEARKVILKKPHQIIFGMDIKNCSFGFSLNEIKEKGQDTCLLEIGLKERYDYWEKCHSIAEDKLGYHIEEWVHENDWLAFQITQSNINSIKDTIDFITSTFSCPPFFILFDGLLINLADYVSDNFIRIAPQPEPYDDDTDFSQLKSYFLLFLQEDFEL